MATNEEDTWKMATPPLLLSVSLVLPPEVDAISHISEQVNDYLLPITIDAAVYNALHRVVIRFGGTRVRTVRAMDGAATRGRLAIIQWLHSIGSEGCSTNAFIGAAANGHLLVLRWLILHYTQHSDPLRCLVAAAENGHVEVVKFLRRQVHWLDVAPAMEAAAAGGHVRSVEALLPANTTGAFIVAAANGRVGVLEFFMDRGYDGNVAVKNAALKKAAKYGHTYVVQLLGPACNEVGAVNALRSAAKWGRLNVVRLMLARFLYKKVEVARALQKAAEYERYEVVKVLIAHFPAGYEEEANWISAGADLQLESLERNFINTTLRLTAKVGNVEIVKMLVERFPFVCIGPALQLAAENRQYDVVEFLLHACSAIHESNAFAGIGMAVEVAATCGDTKMARMLVKKSTLHSVGRALNIAASKNDLDMVKVFAEKPGEYYKVEAYRVAALVQAAKEGKMEVLKTLLSNSNKRTKEEAVLQLAPAVNAELLDTIITKCELDTYQYLFTDAATRGLAGLVQQVMPRVESNSIRQSLVAAASNGHIEAVQMLLDHIDLTSLGEAVEAATRNGQTRVIKLLHDQIDSAQRSMPEVMEVFANKKLRLK